MTMQLLLSPSLPIALAQEDVSTISSTRPAADDAQARWTVHLSDRVVGEMAAWWVNLEGETPGGVRHQLRGDRAGADFDEEYRETESGPALRLRSRTTRTRDGELPVVVDEVLWSWSRGTHLLVLSSHTLFLVIADYVAEIVDLAAATLRLEDDV